MEKNSADRLSQWYSIPSTFSSVPSEVWVRIAKKLRTVLRPSSFYLEQLGSLTLLDHTELATRGLHLHQITYGEGSGQIFFPYSIKWICETYNQAVKYIYSSKRLVSWCLFMNTSFFLQIEKFHVTFTTLLSVSIHFCMLKEPIK